MSRWKGINKNLRCPKCNIYNVAKFGYPISSINIRKKVLLNYSQMYRCRNCDYTEIHLDYLTPDGRKEKYRRHC